MARREPEARHLMPGVAALRHYDRAWLRTDVVAGVTVAAYLVPQVMAYAVIAGLPAVAGLWAILPAMAMYVVFGSSRQLSVGPESTTALMTAVVVGPLAAGDPARYAALCGMLALLVGLICVLGWALRLGFVADLLSRPILVGYMAGVAVIMITSQLTRVTGVPVTGDGFLSEFRSFLTNLDQVDWLTVGFALAVLVLLLVIRWTWPRAPGPLIVVLAATAAVALLNLDLPVVGPIPGGLPAPRLPAVDLTSLPLLLLPAVGIAVVGYSDNVLTARAFAAKGGYSIDANQELLALGTANAGASLMQGFPVSSSGSRTAIAASAGARSQVYSLVAMLTVVLVLLFGRGVLAQFPKAALGALVIYAALLLIDVDEFRRLAAFRPSELVLAVAALAGVLVFGILYGILVAVALSLLDMLRRIARPHDAVLGIADGVAGMHDVDDYPGARTVPGLVVYRYDAPLFFANAADFRRRALDAVDEEEARTGARVAWLILNAEAVTEVDLTAVDALTELVDELAARDVRFGLARAKQELQEDLDRAGVLDHVGRDMVFPTLPTALAGFAARNDPVAPPTSRDS